MLEQVGTELDYSISGTLATGSESIQSLEMRLNKGWDVISAAEREGKPTDALFAHFVALLQQYEALCDGVRTS